MRKKDEPVKVSLLSMAYPKRESLSGAAHSEKNARQTFKPYKIRLYEGEFPVKTGERRITQGVRMFKNAALFFANEIK